MSAEVSEAAVIEGLLPQLRAEGYDVFIDPRPPLVPAFLGTYRPDVIALRKDRNLAIEIELRGRPRAQLHDIAALFEGRSDWQFRIITATPANLPDSLSKQSSSEIGLKLDEVDRLIEGGYFAASFLLSWAVLEALGRSILEEKFRRPQTPGRLVEVLASEGVLTPSEADTVRPLVDIRNRLAHGELDVGASEKDARAIQSILRVIVDTTIH